MSQKSIIMKKETASFLLVFGLIGSAIGQETKLEEDKTAIKSMCGCYEVGFNFAETFSYSEDSTYMPSKTKRTGALEWATLVEDSDNKVVIQHLLIVGDPSEPMVIKHWRQDWVYENTDFYMFNGDNQWLYQEKSEEDVAGQWTQKVFQVDDSPRYEGYATWVHVDGRHYWDSKTDGPLPRREYSHRSDYNVLNRRNHIELTDYGWLHEQDNTKIIRGENGDVILAQEKGFNTYKLQDDSKCAAAVDWWKNNEAYWTLVRSQWKKIYDMNKGVNLQIKIEDKTLWQELFAIGSENEGDKMAKVKTVNKAILSAIEKFQISKS